MTQQEILIVFSIPIVWYLGLLGYKILNLFYLWIKYKLDNIKNKEYQLWD